MGWREKLFNTPTIVRDLFHLQLIDYITAQMDRHWENIMIINKETVKGIDHDFSFGPKPLDEILDQNNPTTFHHHNKGIPKYVDKEVARKVTGYNAGNVHDRIGNLLSVEEVNQTVARLTKVQNYINSSWIGQVSNWEGVGEYKAQTAEVGRVVPPVTTAMDSGLTSNYGGTGRGAAPSPGGDSADTTARDSGRNYYY
jgi:hypothetical protein